MRARTGLAAGRLEQYAIVCILFRYRSGIQWSQWLSLLVFSGRFARAGRAWLMSVEKVFIQGFVVWIDFFFGSIRTCWSWFCTWLVLDYNGMHFCSLDI